MSKTINAGRVTFVPKDNFSNNISYKKFDIVTYNGSSYFAKKDTIGHTPTEEEFWQLVAEKGQNGEPGAVKMQVVDTLPETGETDTIYLVKKDNPGEQNLYDEYVYANGAWEHIGDTSVDLTDYYTKEESDKNLNARIPIFNLPVSDTSFNFTSGEPVENASAIINFLYSLGDFTGHAIIHNNYNPNGAVFQDVLTTIEGINKQKTSYAFIGVYNVGKEYTIQLYGITANIYGTWTNNVFTANRVNVTRTRKSITPIMVSDYISDTNENPVQGKVIKKYIDDQITTVNDKTLYLEGTGLIFGSGLNTAENKQLLTDTINKNIGSYFNVIVRDSDSVLTWTYSFDTLPQTTSKYIKTLAPYYTISVGTTRVYIVEMQINYTYDADKGLYNITQWTMAYRRQLSITDQNEYISGTKTFTTLPKTTLVPTTDDQFVNKKYVDDQVGNINTILATLTTVSEVSK